MQQITRRLTALLGLLLALAVFPSSASDAGGAFALQDFVGRHWTNELVTFPLEGTRLRSARARSSLSGPDGRAIPYQIIVDEASQRAAIAFSAEVRPYESVTYRFDPGRASARTDLRIEETSDAVRMVNGTTGIALRKRLIAGQGPIAGLRLRSGKWIGDTTLNAGRAVSSYSLRVIAEGPVFAEVLCRVTFADQRQWQLRLRLQAHEPVILVDETFSLADASSLNIDLHRNFAPTTLLYRHGSGSVGRLATAPVQAGTEPLFVLEPWLHWGQRERQGTWFGLYNATDADLVAIGAREPAAWVNPRAKPAAESAAQLPLAAARDRVALTLPLRNGVRRWMIGVFDRDTSVAPLKGSDLVVAPLPQQYFIKHGVFPLDQVKEYVLKWQDERASDAGLMLKDADIAALRARFRADHARLRQLSRTPVPEHRPDEHIAYYLATGDAELGAHLAATATKWLQEAVNMYLRQDALPTLGFAPHHQSAVFTALNLAAAVWSSRHAPQGLLERFRGQVAFLAYTVNRDDYWSPQRGFAANPNMTTTVAALQTVLACAVSTHPRAREWVDKGMRELKDVQLEGWADANGGWLEAPHYALVSYDHLLGAFLAAHKAGFNDHLYHPRMKKVLQWLARISTPPDSASKGNRHLLPIGNTYLREPTGEFGIAAFLWRDRDPEFAAEMQWMHRQHGSPTDAGVGGFFPSLAGYRTLLRDDTVRARAPSYKSEHFARTGLILRNHFPGNRETQLHLIAGPNHAHYDRDSGSFTLWGKGRVIANDFGYYGHAPGEDHNMVTAPSAPDEGVMHVSHFAAGEAVDYVRGLKHGSWERQIIFIKHRDPLGPNYFVVADRVANAATAMWRTWFTAEKVALERQGALVRGKEDVDTELFFAERSEGTMKTERKTRETSGMTDGTFARLATTQVGVIVTLKSGETLISVLYPRLRTQERPSFTSVANGNGVRIVTTAGTDHIFAAVRPLTFRDGDIEFQGTVGAVLRRGAQTELWLGQPGRISAHGKRIEAR